MIAANLLNPLLRDVSHPKIQVLTNIVHPLGDKKRPSLLNAELFRSAEPQQRWQQLHALCLVRRQDDGGGSHPCSS